MTGRPVVDDGTEVSGHVDGGPFPYHVPVIALLLAFVAAAGFLLSTLLVDTTLGTSQRFRHLAVVIAAGILLGVTFADLVPEAFESLDGTTAAMSIAVGFLVLFLVEALTGGHTHHYEPHGHDHADGHAPAHAHSHAPDDETCVPRHAIVPFLIGLGIHNLADGLVIGASHEVSDAASTGVAIGILVHQLPVGLSFAAVLLASGVGSRRMRRDAALIAALIPVGTLLVIALPNPSAEMLGWLIGMAAGALLYIAAGHLLPEAHSEERRPLIAAAFATALIGTVLFLGATHDEEAHGHHDDDRHADSEHAEPA
jgi:ZIP family zinc transporter